MRLLLVFMTIAFLMIQCGGQPKSKPKEFYSKDFDWKITIPEGFDSVPPAEWARLQNKGQNAIENTYGEKIDNQSKTIFIFRSDKFNYFESNYQPFDTATEGDYLKTMQEVNGIIYGTFEVQMPGVKLDSASSTEVISGLTFQKFKVNIALPNKMVMTSSMYTRIFGKKEFTVNIMAFDRKKEQLLLDAWRKSTFGKQ